MRRLRLSLLFGVICAMAAALSPAQVPPPAPTCDMVAIRRAFEQKLFPRLVGCSIDQAKAVLGTRFGTPRFSPMATVKAPANTITAQRPAPQTPIDYAQGHVQLAYAVAPTPAPQTPPTPDAPTSPVPQSYSVIDAPQVQEGQPLLFTIRRARVSSEAVALRYAVSGVGNDVVVDRDFRQPPGEAIFPAGDLELQIPIETLIRPGANGPRSVQLSLVDPPEGVEPAPPLGTGTIIDAPDTEAAVFSVLAKSVRRGEPLNFAIRRIGPTDGAYSLAYQTNEEDDGSAMVMEAAADAGLPRITIPEGKDSATLLVAYNVMCARRVTLAISDPQPSGTIAAASASAAIEGEPDPSCVQLPAPNHPAWIYILGGVVATVAIGTFAYRHATRERRQLRHEEATSPPVISCAIDPQKGDLTIENRPDVSPADDMIRVAIKNGSLQPLNQPHVTRKESSDG